MTGRGQCSKRTDTRVCATSWGTSSCPPIYDGYAEPDWYLILCLKIAIAEKDGLYGLVNADGKGDTISSFNYDEMRLLHKYGLFLVLGHGDERQSIMDNYGNVLVPNMAEQIVECKASRVVYRGGNKYGAVMINSNPWSGMYSAFEPIFDGIKDSGPGSFVEFELDGEVGYLSDDREHRFVTKEYDNLEEDITFYKTRWDEVERSECYS